jgi:hypothetical protein
MISNHWRWPLSSHPDLLAPPEYRAVVGLVDSHTKLNSNLNKKKQEVEDKYKEAFQKATKERQARKVGLEKFLTIFERKQ